MPIYLLDSSGNLIGWGDTGTVDTTPPAAPTGVSGTAGNAQATLSWTANTESDLASYRVRRVSTGLVVATVTPPAHSTVITGLTNNTAYHFTVEALDTSGNVSAVSATIDVTPVVPPASATIVGYNTQDQTAPLSGRLIKFANRAPMVRRYNGGFLTSNTFNFTSAVCPEHRVSYSVKPEVNGNVYDEAGLAGGSGNARLKAWCESIPGNQNGNVPWTVYLTYFHEPNDDFRAGTLSVTNYRNTYVQFRAAINSATLQPGVVVKLVCNFMAYQIKNTPTYFDDSWVPPPTVCDYMTIDIYGSPGSFTTSVLTPHCSFAVGPEYGASYPVVATRFKDALEAIVRNGYGQKWGILELNCAPRDWDGPTNPNYVCGANKVLRYEGGRTAAGHDATHTEVARAQWMKDATEYSLHPPVILGEQMAPAKVILYWENPDGAKWYQGFLHDNVWNACKPYVVGSP